MKTLEFTIEINADAKKVWNTMLGPESFKEWTKASFPGTYYEGTWKEGENVKFLSGNGGGTMANIVELKPNQYVLARHVAVVNADGSLDRTSDIAKGWIGSTEAYTFTEKEGKTILKVENTTTPEWEQMFADGWSKNLPALKNLCER